MGTWTYAEWLHEKVSRITFTLDDGTVTGLKVRGEEVNVYPDVTTFTRALYNAIYTRPNEIELPDAYVFGDLVHIGPVKIHCVSRELRITWLGDSDIPEQIRDVQRELERYHRLAAFW